MMMAVKPKHVEAN